MRSCPGLCFRQPPPSDGRVTLRAYCVSFAEKVAHNVVINATLTMGYVAMEHEWAVQFLLLQHSQPVAMAFSCIGYTQIYGWGSVI